MRNIVLAFLCGALSFITANELAGAVMIGFGALVVLAVLHQDGVGRGL